MNLFDSCTGKQLPPHFSWMNESPEWEFNSNSRLTVTAPANADFFVDPSSSGDHHVERRSAPFLYTTVKGDFTISTRVEVKMNADYDSACLMVMANDRNWAKICYENSYQIPSIVSVVTRELSDDCNGEGSRAYCPYLRITRMGSAFAFHYSFDRKFWRLKRFFSFGFSPEEVKVGVVMQCPSGQSCTGGFDFLEYTPEPVKDIRSGV